MVITGSPLPGVLLCFPVLIFPEKVTCPLRFSPNLSFPTICFSHSYFLFIFFSEGNFVYIIDTLETNFMAKIRSSCLMQIPWKHLRTKRAHNNYFLRTFLQHPTTCSSQSPWAKCKFFTTFYFSYIFHPAAYFIYANFHYLHHLTI